MDHALGSAIGTCPVELKLSDIYQEILWHAMAYSPFPEEHALFKHVWEVTRRAVAVFAKAYEEVVQGRTVEESEGSLRDPERIRAVGKLPGMPDEAVRLIPGVLHYGVGTLKYAHHFLALADPKNRRPTDEFFRRLVQCVFPQVRDDIYRGLSWENLTGL